jgi:3-oxoadipate CoA-transferase, alpha subunit
LASGFGGEGNPANLLDALVLQGPKGLTIISTNAGNAGQGIAKLVLAKRVRIKLESALQGPCAERNCAGSAGIGGFYESTGNG